MYFRQLIPRIFVTRTPANFSIGLKFPSKRYIKQKMRMEMLKKKLKKRRELWTKNILSSRK